MSIRSLSPELAEKARIELNEDPKRIASDLQHIKDWLAKQPHIHARTDDQWLIAFLRGCKYSLERVKEKMDLFYTLRTLSPELYANRDYHTKIFDYFMDLGVFIVLPKIAYPMSPRLVITRPGKCDPSKYGPIDLMGVMLTIQKNAAPMRMKGIIFINAPATFETILNLLKSFMNEKNRNRIFMYDKNPENIYKHIPKSILPSEYGGAGGTIKEITDAWKAKRRQLDSWLEEDMQYKTDESKRPGQPRTAESLFGFEGSFRKLEFD